nr:MULTISPECIES: hypothetical protein [unclassified Rhodococcus (in: high G+C Gram-positive bacteria)]
MRRKHTDDRRATMEGLAYASNPLLRRSDRIQSRLKTILTTLAILMLPVAAWLAMTTLSFQNEQVSAQQYTRHAVTAETVSVTQPSPLVQSDFSSQSSSNVDATWTYQGVEHTGQVSVLSGSPVGTEVDIWVDDNGIRASQPLSNSDAIAAAAFTGIGSLFLSGLLLYGIYAATRFHLDNKRDAEWELAIRNFMDENSLS